MKVLLIGGTGLISTGIVKHLLERKAEVWMLNRGQRENTLAKYAGAGGAGGTGGANVKTIHGDRYQPAVLQEAAKHSFDAVIDMCCFDPNTCSAAIAAFAGKTKQFIFCSTVCTYGVKVPVEVLVDEEFPQEPISGYGRNKLACEKLVFEAGEMGSFKATVMRPSCTYGPGNSLIDNIEFDPVAWDRIVKGKPVVCAGDGLGLWVATHRDDVGAGFAYAVGNAKAYGQAYNLTRAEHVTWREYYRQVGMALGERVRITFLPANAIVKADEKRFGLLKEITAFHGAYDSQKAENDIPEFHAEIGLVEGAGQTLADVKRRNAWKTSEGDKVYEELVAKAEALGGVEEA
jgi:nucleoside-diphosphate-sugar epimerase